MRNLIFIFGIFSFELHADFPVCPNDMVLAKDFIRAEVHGWRLPSIGKACLKNQNFKYFKVAPMRAEEYEPKTVITVKSGDDVKIENILNEGDNITVEISITDSKGQHHKDQFSFARNSGELLETFGCLSPVDPPQTAFVLTKCKK